MTPELLISDCRYVVTTSGWSRADFIFFLAGDSAMPVADSESLGYSHEEEVHHISMWVRNE